MAAFPGTMGLKVKFYDGYLKPDDTYRAEGRTGACQSGGGGVAQLPRSQADPDGSINFTASVCARPRQLVSDPKGGRSVPHGSGVHKIPSHRSGTPVA